MPGGVLILRDEGGGSWAVENTLTGKPAEIYGIGLAGLGLEQAVRAYRAFDHKTGVLKIHYQGNVVSFFGKVWRRRQQRKRVLRLID